jgi:hypothetical protein
MRDEPAGGVGGGPHRDDLDVELQGWDECAIAFGVAEKTFRAGAERMRLADTALERDRIRAEVHGFCRRLALGMLALAMPGDVTETTGEKP